MSVTPCPACQQGEGPPGAREDVGGVSRAQAQETAGGEAATEGVA